MPSNGNDITLKMNVDIKDADSAIKSFNNTTQKAFKSSNTYVNSLGNSLNKVTQNIQNTKAKMDTLANTRVPTDKFKTLQTTIASLEKQVSSAKKELDAIGKTRLYTTQYQGVTDKVNDLSKKLQVARTELGKLQTFGTNKDKKAILDAQVKVNSLTKQLKYAIDKQIQLEQAGQKFQANSAYDTQTQKVNTLTKALQQANYQAQQMQANNTAYMSGANTEEYAQLSRQLGNAVNQGSILQKTINNIHSGGHKLAQIFKNFGTSAKNAISRVANAIKNKLNGAINHTSNNHNKSFKKMLTTVLKYGFGIRSIFLLYRKLRAVMKEGLTSMAQQFTETRVQVESLKNSWSGFKASLVSAFQPIFSYVVPALVTLINYLTSAMNTLANFFAILTGQGWYYKAKKGNQSVAKSIGGTGAAAKEANEQLAEYDDLLVIDQDKGGSGGGGGGGGGDSDAWNWEKTDASPSKFAELLKEAFKTWDFTEVGEYVGQKLTDALNSINWDRVYQTAKNFGKGLATFLNGLISPELFGALGTTVANAITTALLFLNTFGTTFDWKDFGHSIAAGIEKFVEHSPLKLAVNTFNVWAKGILDTLITAVRDLLDNGTINEISEDIAEAIGELDLGGIAWKAGTLISGLLNSLYIIVSNKDTWKNLGTKIGDGINGLFKSMNQIDPKTGLTGWGALAKDVSSLATGLLEMITRAVETIEWDEVGKAIADFISNIDWGQVIIDLGKLALAIASAIASALIGLVTNGDVTTNIGTAILTLIGAAKLFNLGSKLTALISGALGSEFKSSISTKLILGFAGLALLFNSDDIGTAIGKKIAEAFGDDELVSYYEEYNTWPKIRKRIQEDSNLVILDLTNFTLNVAKIWESLGKIFASVDTPIKEAIDRVKDYAEKMAKTIFNAGKDTADAFERGLYGGNSGLYLSPDENYEFDANGGVHYAYAKSGSTSNAGNKRVLYTVQYQLEGLYNKGFISQKKLNEYLEGLNKLYKLSNKKNVNFQSLIEMMGDINSMDDLKKFIDYMNNLDGEFFDHDADYTIDVNGDANNKSDLDKLGGSMNYLNGQWHNNSATETIATDVDGKKGNGIANISNLGDTFKTKLTDVWKGQKAVFTAEASGVDSVKKAFDGLASGMGNKQVDFKVNWIDASKGDAGYQAYNDMWNSFTGASVDFKVNFTTTGSSGLNNAVGTLVDRINQALAESGSKTRIQVPDYFKTATGGVVTAAQMRLVGEAGAEAIVPLENNLGWLNKMATMITDEMIATNRLPDITKGNVLPSSSQFLQATSTFATPEKEDKAVGLLEQILTRLNTDGNSNMPPIVLQLNGRQMAEVVWDESNKRYRQTGNVRYAR